VAVRIRAHRKDQRRVDEALECVEAEGILEFVCLAVGVGDSIHGAEVEPASKYGKH
jgi:hypothetical protein